MKTQLSLLALAATIIITSCQKDEIQNYGTFDLNVETLSQESDTFLTIEQINTYIDKSFSEKGSFSWDDAPANVLWSAAVHGHELITVGYGGEGESFREAKSTRLENIQDDIVNVVSASEGLTKSAVKYIADDVLNVIDIQVTSLETIRTLRATPDIRYLEPNGYSFYELKPAQGPAVKSSSGCNFDGANLLAADYRTVAPNALVSWTFDRHNIEQAWSLSTGAGITVGVIDTGLSASQPKLGSEFTDGFSINSRTVQKYGTFIDSPWWWSNNYDGPNDKCGHGTSMAATIAAPRNDENMPVGVAYDSNLVSYRATEDVVLNDYHERKGVSDALKALGNRSDVKIISMSVGYPWSIGNVRDAVKYAYNRGKLIFAAGGTSLNFTNWYPVIFPASMSETVAVTGITDAMGYNQCDTCHDGSQIEFTVVMERDNDNGRTGVTLGFYDGDNDYVGGSSVATATTAGIAALVWAKHPSWSRTQVLNKLRQSADLYPYKDNNYGYGNIDANLAVQ
ncbi:serine protease [Dokdonia sinensis]|uniref:Serine protease n=1 Tax=Dokdonia sinensis TaxID=2479847 RepID=A0A3M0FVU5_9FLAO|nr:S8 family serine peptidase [Dokdonia sinensis]RMB56625.1 serine protease [Dokdonia sinensis]